MSSPPSLRSPPRLSPPTSPKSPRRAPPTPSSVAALSVVGFKNEVLELFEGSHLRFEYDDPLTFAQLPDRAVVAVFRLDEYYDCYHLTPLLERFKCGEPLVLPYCRSPIPPKDVEWLLLATKKAPSDDAHVDITSDSIAKVSMCLSTEEEKDDLWSAYRFLINQ